MGIVIDPSKAFKTCYGYKLNGELILWSKGVVGALSDEQEKMCQMIIIENAEGGPAVVFSYEDALRVKAKPVTSKTARFMAIKTCAELLDLAEDRGLIRTVFDTWAFMDYCMAKLGFGKVDRYVPEDIKRFIDQYIDHPDMIKGMTKIEKLERIIEEVREKIEKAKERSIIEEIKEGNVNKEKENKLKEDNIIKVSELATS